MMDTEHINRRMDAPKTTLVAQQSLDIHSLEVHFSLEHFLNYLSDLSTICHQHSCPPSASVSVAVSSSNDGKVSIALMTTLGFLISHPQFSVRRISPLGHRFGRKPH
mmetsp:Transcript_9361/g.15511  ORF Transcript_9361/g.15511 Transcript_9361/m.15511 type:complete len:107 (-) Transcript_9361:932-1252(-)